MIVKIFKGNELFRPTLEIEITDGEEDLIAIADEIEIKGITYKIKRRKYVFAKEEYRRVEDGSQLHLFT